MIAIGNRRSLRALALALMAAAAVSASACGSDDDGGSATAQASNTAEEQVMTTMREFRTALKTADGDSACALMTDSFVAEFEKFGDGAKCPEAFEEVASGDIFEDLSPSDLKTTVNGDKAAISGYVSHLGERQTAHFVKQGGEWKIQIWFRNRN